MAAKSILPSGNTTFLPELENGTADLSLASLLIGTGVGNITLTSIDSGVLSVSGAIAPSDIQDNSGSIGTPGQVLVKADAGTDMLWSSDISVSGAITAGTGFTATTGGLTCASGEVVAATAQIGAGTTTGNVIFQVGNPDTAAVNFSVGTGAGNPLTIGSGIASAGNITAPSGTINAFSGITTTNGGVVATNGNIVASNGAISASTTITAGTGFTATAGGLTCRNGEVVAATAQIGAGTTTGNVIFQVGNPDTVAINFSVGTGAGNPLTIGSAIKATGLVDANGSTGENGQYPIANGAGGFVWTTP
jgi:hypothetical protein